MRDPSRWYVVVVLESTSVSFMVYEMMMPFCPCGAGGCQEKDTVLGPRTSPAKLKGGDDGAEGKIDKILSFTQHSWLENLTVLWLKCEAFP